MSVSIGRLPTTSGTLFGRDDELRWLDACWQDGVRVASVVAWGGVGKTALVNRWLREVSEPRWRGAERVFAWSFYSQGTEPISADAFVEAALKWFGDADPNAGSPWDKGERLAQLVRAQRTLLVVDGVEPLQEGPEGELGRFQDRAFQTLVKELGAENPGLCLLTTRVPLVDVEAEDGTRVRELKLERLSAEAGAQLLADRGAKGEAAELRAAVDEYDGHAFALHLLAGYLRKRYKGDIGERRCIPVLEGKAASRMMGMYERWFAGKPEMAVLRVLGLFDRPATKGEVEVLRTRPAIPGITKFLKDHREPAWNELVTTLRDVGLVAAEGESEKLDAHPLVREHFGEQLKRELPEGWREGNRRLYEYLKGKAEEYPETVEKMVQLYQAVVHGCRAGRANEAREDVYWARIQRREEWFNRRELGALGSEATVLSAFFSPPGDRLVTGLDKSSEAWVMNEASFAARALGRIAEARRLMRLATAHAVTLSDPTYATTCLCNSAELAWAEGDLWDAESMARSALDLASRTEIPFVGIAARATWAAILHALGRGQQAAEAFAEAEAFIAQRGADPPILPSPRGFWYCDLLLDQHRWAEVLPRAEQTVEFAERKRWQLDIALARISMGRARALASRAPGSSTSDGSEDVQEGLDALRRANRLDYLPVGLLARAAIRIHELHVVDAHRDLTEALRLSARCGFRLHVCDVHLGFARLALAEHKPADALDNLARARVIIDETSYHRRDGELAELTAEAETMSAEILRQDRQEREEEESGAEPSEPLRSSRPLAPLLETSASAPTSPTLTATPPAAPSPSATAANEDPAPMPHDIAIICALRTPELEKVLATGKQPWEKRPQDTDDPTTYRITTFTTPRGRALSVIAAAPNQMGMPAAAVLTTKMVRLFRPKLVVMVGIAAGVKSDAQGFGDILAPETTLDYGAGKISSKDGKLHLSPDPNPIKIDSMLRNRLKEWTAEEDRLASIRKQWPAKKPSTVLAIHVGPLGSGAAVVTARETVAATQEHWRKLIGIEMEAYGVHLACEEAVRPPPMFLCLKSICDFAGPDKDDDWQEYAAYTAAQLCHAFITEEWETLFPTNPR